MKQIVYELTKNSQAVADDVKITLPSDVCSTGEGVTAQVTLGTFVEDYNYYVVDWGDGMWSYNGPYVYRQGRTTPGFVYHTYRKAGEYQVRACAVNLKDGKRYGWSDAQTLKVSGEDYEGEMITGVTPFASSFADNRRRAKNILDGSSDTRWQSAPCPTADADDYVGLMLDGYYTLDTLEIKFPAEVDAFPSNITIEYTTDKCQTWYMLPHYYYVLPNSKRYYDCVMNFPNPKGATLSLKLDGIAANGIRIRALTYLSEEIVDRILSVEEMRVYGKKGTFLYTSYDGYYSADLSNMWAIFGTAKTEPDRVGEEFRSGVTQMGSVEWLAWDGIQLNWTGYTPALDKHLAFLKSAVYGGDGWYYDEAEGKYVVDESEYENNPRNDGFIWAVSGAPKHLGAQNHYVNNSSLIIAVRDYLLTGNNTDDLLTSVNYKGQVMLDKLRKAMEYMLVDLNGQSGLMTIYDPRNDGTVHGLASNYWDSLNCYGYNSAYENVFFYQSVLAMADIEEYVGNMAEAERYREIAKKVKKVFNDYFWDEKKGRYITSVNVKGDVIDFGITHISFMAVAAGLASDEQAKAIYDWVDGRRIIEGDDSVGEDIYEFKVAARSNTYGIEHIEEDGIHYWWYNGHSFNDVIPGHWGLFGQQMQNGGTIFYISYYDVAGRTQLSGDLAIERFNVIMDEFHIDALRRDPRTQWGYYLVSINGEFPESGLVPAAFVTDIIGITPEVKGLKIEACLPSDMTYAGIKEYHFANRAYHIEVNKDLAKAEMTLEGDVYAVKVPADKTYYITLDNKLIEG